MALKTILKSCSRALACAMTISLWAVGSSTLLAQSDVPVYDVQVTQIVSADSVAVGDTITVTVKATNVGPELAHEVTLSFNLVDSYQGWEVVSAETDSGSKQPGLLFGGDNLQPGETMTVTLVLRAMLPGPEEIHVGTGYHTIYGPGETDTTNNEAINNVLIEGKVLDFDLAAEIKLSPSRVQPGGLVLVELAVKNLGPDEATSVRLGTATKPTPMGFFNLGDLILESVQDAGPWEIAINEGYLSAGLPLLEAGESSTITLVFRAEEVLPSGVLVHQMGVSSNLWSEANSSNNHASSNRVSVIDAPEGSLSDLEITSTGAAQTDVGATYFYQVEARNNGPNDAVGAYVANIVPQGMRVVAASADRGVTVVTGNLVTLQDAPLAVGETAKMSIRVVPEEGGESSFSGAVAASVFDPVMVNNRVQSLTIVDDPGATAAADWQLYR